MFRVCLFWPSFCFYQKFRFFQKSSVFNSSNFKRKFWLNYMTYSFVLNTSGLLWFSRFQKGAALVCSPNRYWFISVFVTFTKNLDFAKKQEQENCRTLNGNCGNSIWPTALSFIMNINRFLLFLIFQKSEASICSSNRSWFRSSFVMLTTFLKALNRWH